MIRSTAQAKESVIKQVLALQNKSTAELKELWRSIFDTDAPPHSKTYLIPRLAYRLQELAYGPMAEKSAKQLDNLADQMEKGKKFSNHYMASKPLAGTKLIREFQGDLHEVLVSESGFIYQGQSYKSLSAIARKITGTRWNGPAFFGLRGNKEA
jgi:hypothetical protein